MLPRQVRIFLAEVLGTFMLVWGGTFAISAVLRMGAGGTVPHLAIAFGFGLSLLAGLFAFAQVSGGHFNPAVSLAMCLARRIKPAELISYWAAQAIGAIGGAVFLYWITNRAIVKATVTQPGAGTSQWTALLVEVLLTAFFVVVILEASQMDSIGIIAIPLTLVAVHLAGIPFSGASVNPARSLGPALVGGNWHAFWVYVAGPAIGAVVAWGLHTLIVEGERTGAAPAA